MKAFVRLALIGLALALGATGARADLITFTGDSTGAKPNGFMSVHSSNVTFTDTQGADLQIFDWGVKSIGNGLDVLGDDESNLPINFQVFADMHNFYSCCGNDASKFQNNFNCFANALSLQFGNDDPGFSNAGDAAYLQLFNGATLIQTVTVVMNRDDIMNQSISYTGAAFNRAEFY